MRGRCNFALAFGKGASPTGAGGSAGASRKRERAQKNGKNAPAVLRSRRISVTLQNLSARNGGAEDTETITIDKRDEVVQEPQGASPAGPVDYRVRQVQVLLRRTIRPAAGADTHKRRKSLIEDNRQRRV